jgi:hypothetical protein
MKPERVAVSDEVTRERETFPRCSVSLKMNLSLVNETLQNSIKI